MKMSLLGKKDVHQMTLQGRKPLSAKQRSREALRTPRNDPGDRPRGLSRPFPTDLVYTGLPVLNSFLHGVALAVILD